jgi:hypothetical protein
MKIKGVLEFEYELTPEEVREITGGEDRDADYMTDAEEDFFDNDPEEFIQQRLIEGKPFTLDNSQLDVKIMSWK